ncbi:MAG: hypothetical protein J6V25_02015 [Oscillospiraceae bacterium]|nr:hypothetical protein [Oscillospiraceae bacterium]
MNFMDYILMGAACIGVAAIIIIIIAAAIMMTWWEATEGSGAHESTQR